MNLVDQEKVKVLLTQLKGAEKYLKIALKSVEFFADKYK
jgi:hypothetical protein